MGWCQAADRLLSENTFDPICARCRSSELVDSDSAEWDSDHEADTDAQQQLGEWLGQLQVLSNVSRPFSSWICLIVCPLALSSTPPPSLFYTRLLYFVSRKMGKTGK
uniref:Uncharacterized protein n=1 Tax=Plectus sambesii TaxID=2011161 RepID=A0A914XN76_9BILA